MNEKADNKLNEQAANTKMLTRLMFRLLPIQILLSAVASVNGIVSSLFASNYVGAEAMSAVTLYGPFTQLINAVGLMLCGGATIICGRYIGRNEQNRAQSVFSLDIVISCIIGAVFILGYVIMVLTGLTGIFTNDEEVRRLFSTYLLGQAIGILPTLLGSQLAAFLSLENKSRRTTSASLVYIAVNIIFNFIFVKMMGLEAFGLALASSLGMWVFVIIQSQYFFTPKASIRFTVKGLRLKDTGEIVVVGLPGALSTGYQTVRGLIVNGLITAYVGSAGLSAFGACNNFLAVFWAIPAGMLAVSRLIISVSVGEEDRQTLTDVMRIMIKRYIPLMSAVCAVLILLAVPLTRLFYRDPAEDVYMMTVWGFRILPLCMPLAIFCMHIVCYGQTSGKQMFVHVISLLDGVVCVAGFTAILMPLIGMNSVYIANVLNGVVTVIFPICYAWIKCRHFPRKMEELMVIPEDFGVTENERLDLSIRNIEDVVKISQSVQDFCLSRGIDDRCAHLAALAMEEMAGNIVDHGFTKDNKKHYIDARVVHKGNDVILRLKDDCIAFNPGERLKIADSDDPLKNIGLRMIFRIASDVQYQNILGLNVLTMKI